MRIEAVLSTLTRLLEEEREACLESEKVLITERRIALGLSLLDVGLDPDGSAIVSINVPNQSGKVRPAKKGEVRIREIRGRIKKPGAQKWSEVRRVRRQSNV